jgi:hypothetical protein
MLPKNSLINLLYRYKLVKQAILNNSVKEACLKQLQYRDQVRQLTDLHKSNSLLKKASLLNDLYKQAVLIKLADISRGRRRYLAALDSLPRDYGTIEGLANAIKNKAVTLSLVEDAIATGRLKRDFVEKLLISNLLGPDEFGRIFETAKKAYGKDFAEGLGAALSNKGGPLVLASPNRGGPLVLASPNRGGPPVPLNSAGTGAIDRYVQVIDIPYTPDAVRGALPTANTLHALPASDAVRGALPTANTLHALPASDASSGSLSRLKQLFSTIGNKIKSNKQGLIGGGVGLLTGLGAGLLSGRSSDSAYDRGKADAIKNLSQEDIKALLASMGSKK